MRRFAVLAVMYLLLSGQIPSGGTEGGRLLIGGCVWLAKQAVEAQEGAEREEEARQERIARLSEQSEMGDAEARYELSKELFGLGRSAEALRWLCLAAHQENPKAQAAFADRQRDGTAGGSANHLMAYVWYGLAASNGSRYAEIRIKSLEKTMSQKEIKQAEDLIAAWAPDPESCEIEEARTSG